jgi:hypothetical protein
VQKLLFAAAAFALSGCAATTPIASSFNPAEVAWFTNASNASNTISGSGVMRTVGGEAKTCAAVPVDLVPESTYARERMMALYGSTESGFNRAFMGRRAAEMDPGYDRTTLRAICDAQGNFVFERVPDGSYFVTTQITWLRPGSYVYEGGWLMRRVTVTGGESVRIVLSP